MLTKIKEEELMYDNIAWICIMPFILKIQGKSMETKFDLYWKLNDGQRGLYMFYSYHNHTKSIFEFFWFAFYFMSEVRSWIGLKNGMSFFNEPEIINIYEELETLIESKYKSVDGTWLKASPSDIEKDKELFVSVNKLYIRYNTQVPHTIKEMNSYIRNHKEEFIEFE
ncbi:hypothetical protein [Paenibacillus glacialis]|uniref:DUF4375 domain-containing protein n=1 Tax=Paenibacillus glacialis TaxID=494026 RepID=A0A168HPE9_9BACL|nr:hypothetical protein [Paenibacillus glacialis]OAB38391.1 hypothetical protein PGLA_20055 [Paenibacillus glacialis]